MDNIYRLSLLFDFYGELLTVNQYDILNDYVNQDLTISEIASNREISRQSVHETLKRAEQILDNYELKLNLVKRFSKVKQEVGYVLNILDNEDVKDKVEEIKTVMKKILENL